MYVILSSGTKIRDLDLGWQLHANIWLTCCRDYERYVRNVSSAENCVHSVVPEYKHTENGVLSIVDVVGRRSPIDGGVY